VFIGGVRLTAALALAALSCFGYLMDAGCAIAPVDPDCRIRLGIFITYHFDYYCEPKNYLLPLSGF
jgi:hypothetical protein